MFKLVHWAYKKGVEHERNRIRRLISEFALDTHRSRQRTMRDVANMSAMSGKKQDDRAVLQRAEYLLAVSQEAEAILNRLLWQPGSNEDQGYSPLEDEEKITGKEI